MLAEAAADHIEVAAVALVDQAVARVVPIKVAM